MLPPTMSLARVHGPGDVRLDTVPVPTCSPGEVLVRIAACGVCGSDLGYIAQGGLGGGEPLTAPLPLGHEFAGTVVTIGPGVTGIAPGLRVAVNPDRAFIGGGGPDGAMAPYVRVSGAELGETLFPLPDHLPFDEAALAEPLSVALHGLRVARVKAPDKVAILGAGPIGLCALVMLTHLGLRDVAIFDRVDERLDRALALGAGLAINVRVESLTDALARFHGGGKRFGSRYVDTDIFVDCAGSAPALAEALAVAKYRARVSVIALHHKPLPLDLWRLMANEITLSGSIADARAAEFGEAVAMLAQARQELSPLISHRIDFAGFHEALATAADAARAAKVVLTFPEAA
ncbi:zinc-binding dehydrogenase [Novosphingobium sp. PP1Y]|uniref:zinc-dependent alcohol dehydrogenase n=1 Tax=Novosphingobium sp. PP1Y TaxID=702113 RepID=UPI0011D25CF6|nr:zinc-binding dehydrogenase [Novosphingobium sp. PP1Y]